MLSSDVIKILPDISGARSANRFGFQGDWAICEILDRFAKGENFLFLFDYHEDVVVLTADSIDFVGDFYQVKTNEKGNWSKNDLLKGKKSKKKLPDGKTEIIELPSIMGKLYSNKYNFQKGVKSLNMVSNARFNFTLKDGTKTDKKDLVCLVDLADDDLDEFQEHIKIKYTLQHSCDFPDYTYFKVTDLSVNGSATHATGKIAETLEQLFPATKISSKTIYKAIADDVKRKNNKEKVYSDFQDLAREKGVSRKEIEKILDSNIKLSSESRWTDVSAELMNDRIFSFHDRRQLQDKFREIYLRVPFATTVFENAKAQIMAFYESNCSSLNLSEAVNHIHENLVVTGLEEQSHDQFFIKALIIYAIYE